MKRILLMAVLASSCASEVRRDEPLLPFNIAVAPVHCGVLSEPVDPSAPAPEKDDMQLAIDPADLASRMKGMLEMQCFARVTLLEPPADESPDEFAHKSAEQRDAYWTEAAKRASADLLLESELRAAPQMHNGTNEKFWLNLPLFFAGGPFCYFISDNAYNGDARLDAWVYDLRSASAARESAQDAHPELAHVQARFTNTDLNFLARAGGNVALYALSFVVPAGFLSRKSDRVEQRVAEEASEDLAQGLVRELHSEAEHVLRGDSVSSFHVAAESQVTWRDAELEFTGEVILRVGEIERMDRWKLEASGCSSSGEFRESLPSEQSLDAQDRYLRYPLAIRMRCERADTARLTVVGGGRNAISRTFTFRVRAECEESARVALR